MPEASAKSFHRFSYEQGAPSQRQALHCAAQLVAFFPERHLMPGPDLEPLDLEPGLLLDLPMIAGPKVTAAHAYLADRKRYITTDPEIFGGVPTVKGTRVPVYAIHGRLADGDTIDDLLEDHPEIPREAFVTADIYARTHPERGRPVVAGRP